MPKTVRLHKYIANCGYCSRRHAELLIAAGLVQVNGRIAMEPGTGIAPARDAVSIHGERILPPPSRTIMLHKPAGFISSTHDTHERLTVMDLIPRALRHDGVTPAGRLDLDTEGLLVLTNNGDLLHRITHPRYMCPKEYLARVQGRVSAGACARLERGVLLDDGPTQPSRILARHYRSMETELHLELTEGRKREVKRMLAAVGHEVLYLKRLRVGALLLGDLPRGAWRDLTGDEVQALYAACMSAST